MATGGAGAGAPRRRSQPDLPRAARPRRRGGPPRVGAARGAARLPGRTGVRDSGDGDAVRDRARRGARAPDDRGRRERAGGGAGARGCAAHAAPRRRRCGGLVPERSDGCAQDFRRRSPGARAALPAPLAGRAARDDPPHRNARRVLPAGRRTRLARTLSAVLRAARRRERPRRLEAAARQLEQLLVARPRCVAGARRAGASAAGDALGAAVRREPLHPDRRARRRLRGSRLARPARPWECVGHVALVAARGRGRGGRRGAGCAPGARTTGAEPAAASPEASAAQAVQQAITGYRQQASLFASRQTGCADLARGLTDVDDAWLRYTLASPPAGTAQSGLAADVDQVEADFERSGCPRP